MISRTEQREIMRADRERRRQRQLDDDARLLGITLDTSNEQHTPHAMVVKADARALGAVTALTTRAHRSSWDRGMRGRTFGVAPGTELTATEPTFRRILADGTETVESVKRSKRS